MKILVAVKRVIDFNVHIRIKSDESGIETNQVKMSMNPFDEIAVEEAIRLKEKGIVKEITVVSIGRDDTQETLRMALAMGADQALHIKTDEVLEPLNIAKVLKEIALREKPALILLGKQAIDSDDNQTGQMLAAMLGWPQGTFISKLDISVDTVVVTREVDGGLEILQLTLPAVLTTDLRLNTPRYLTLPNIVHAKKKPLTQIVLSDLSLDIAPRMKILKISAPKSKARGIKVNSIKELVSKLKLEARIP